MLFWRWRVLVTNLPCWWFWWGRLCSRPSLPTSVPKKGRSLLPARCLASNRFSTGSILCSAFRLELELCSLQSLVAFGWTCTIETAPESIPFAMIKALALMERRSVATSAGSIAHAVVSADYSVDTQAPFIVRSNRCCTDVISQEREATVCSLRQLSLLSATLRPNWSLSRYLAPLQAKIPK